MKILGKSSFSNIVAAPNMHELIKLNNGLKTYRRSVLLNERQKKIAQYAALRAVESFFDLGDDVAAEPSPNTPKWVNHISFRVNTVQELENTKARLQAHGIEVLGVTDHHIFKSIYFFDPNGIRLELTAQLEDEFQMLQESKTAHARLAEWNARKEQWRKERAASGVAAPLKPQANDRPEFVPPSA